VPAFATGTTIQNPFGVDCIVYVTATNGATITGVSVGLGFGGTGLQSITPATLAGPAVVPVRLPGGQTIQVTGTAGTGALSWRWFGD
jgi:hypothetical protein